jgi:hypothetical protein
MLTIELDGMDVRACEDAYECVAHLLGKTLSVRSQANRTAASAARRSLNNDTHLVKPDGEQPSSQKLRIIMFRAGEGGWS